MEKGSSLRGSAQPPAPAPPPKRLATGAAAASPDLPHPLRRTVSGAGAPSPEPPRRTISESGPRHLQLFSRPPAATQEPRPENPLLLLASSLTEKLSLGCPLLDRLLSGGLPVASVTEIVGESASGKTQLCLQLALLAPHSSSSSSSLFLCSELPFPLRRLRLLAPYPELLDHIFVAFVYTPSHLLTLISRAQHHLSHPTSSPIRLIIIDSIASLFRADFGASPADLKRRCELFFKISSKLKELAYRHQCVVVVTNQVVDFFKENLVTNTIAWSSGRQVSPALGLSWANCVNTRLFLTKEVGSDGGCTRRHIKVAFAPHLPEQTCEFVIKRDGVFGVKPVARLHGSLSDDDDYVEPSDDDYVEPSDDYISDEEEV